MFQALLTGAPDPRKWRDTTSPRNSGRMVTRPAALFLKLASTAARPKGVSRLLCKRPSFVFGGGVPGKGAVVLSQLWDPEGLQKVADLLRRRPPLLSRVLGHLRAQTHLALAARPLVAHLPVRLSPLGASAWITDGHLSLPFPRSPRSRSRPRARQRPHPDVRLPNPRPRPGRLRPMARPPHDEFLAPNPLVDLSSLVYNPIP